MGLFGDIVGFLDPPKDYYADINPPNPEELKLRLEEYVQQGILTPEQARTIQQDPSAFEKITTSPEFKEASLRALSGLQDVADEGGLTATDRAKLHDVAREEGIRERGSREAILSNAAERGVGGSGLEFLSALKNQQGGAERTSDRDTQVAADAEQRALQALIEGGKMGSELEGQEFREKSEIASARDAVNRFNTANLNDTERGNVDIRNAAAAKNLAAKQAISDSNVGLRNSQQQYNKNLSQQLFENKITKAKGQQGVADNNYVNRGNAISGIESGVADLFGGAYDALTKKKEKGSV